MFAIEKLVVVRRVEGAVAIVVVVEVVLEDVVGAGLMVVLVEL